MIKFHTTGILNLNNYEAENKSKLILEFPTSNGSFEKFSVIKSSIMEEELQKKYKNVIHIQKSVFHNI